MFRPRLHVAGRHAEAINVTPAVLGCLLSVLEGNKELLALVLLGFDLLEGRQLLHSSSYSCKMNCG